MTDRSLAVKAMRADAVRFVALDRLLGDYADAQASLIGHTSGDMDADYLALRDDLRERCRKLDHKFRQSFLPAHVQIRLQEIGYEVGDA